MRIGIQINRALIATNAFFRGRKNGAIDNKTILIVFQQIFGDAIVIQNSLEAYTNIFPINEGYKIVFLARPSVLAFMRDTLPLPEDINFEAVDFKKFLEDYGYYKEIVKGYHNLAGTVIVPGTSLSAEIFTSSMNAKRKVGLIRSIDVTRPWVMAYFYKKAYTETVRPEKEDMMLQRHRRLLNYLGDKEYRAQLPELLEMDSVIDGQYAVMCPGSSRAEKCWPIERFAKIADYLIEKCGITIHLCGGADEKDFEDKLLLHLNPQNKKMVVSHIGKTSFSDWSAIVQNAKIVIGNDSATMHLAAAARVPSVCIAGVYDKYQFFPYKVDKIEHCDRLPVTMFKDMPCEWCRTIGYDAGFGNEDCKKRIDTGLCSTCIDLITVDEVKIAIDNLLKEK